MANHRISAVIVVEGKKDTQRLRLIDPQVRTIETRGAAVSQKVISLIKRVIAKEEVIIFTDPDFSGERIRRIISQAVPQVKQAFLRQKDAIPQKNCHHASLGVEHASTAAILAALAEVPRETGKSTPQILQSDLLKLKLVNSPSAEKNRRYLCDQLNIGMVNGAHLAQRLQLIGLTLPELKEVMEKRLNNAAV